MMPGQTITQATQQQVAQPTVVQLVNKMGPEIQRALPDHLSGERVARLALTAIRLNSKLGECRPESFVGALLTAAAIGVEVGTPEAYLVPYQRECTLIVGYQGYTKLFWQHPQAQSLNAQAVHERDEFDYAYGLAPLLRHKPAKGDRGKIIYYYAAVSLSTGGQHFEVFTPEEIKELRSGKVGGNGGIADPRRWMERKTAIRQVLKPMPKSVQLSGAVQADERPGSELYMERVAEKSPATALAGPADAEGITDAQVKKLHTVLTKVGYTDREQGLDYYARVIGRRVESSKDLTKTEAVRVIDSLEHLDGADPATGEVVGGEQVDDGPTQDVLGAIARGE